MKAKPLFARRVAKTILPLNARRWIKSRIRPNGYVPPIGRIAFGDFRRVLPIGRDFGFSRGDAVDRFYIDGRNLSL